MDIGVALLSPTIEGGLINLRERRVEQKTRYQVRIGNKRFTERDGVDFVLSDRRLCARLIVAVISNVKPSEEILNSDIVKWRHRLAG